MKYLKNEKVRILVRFLISRKRFFFGCAVSMISGHTPAG